MYIITLFSRIYHTRLIKWSMLIWLLPATLKAAATSTNANAPITYTLIEDSVTDGKKVVDVCNYLGAVFVLLIGITAVLAVIVLVIAGIELAGGAASAQARADAKNRIVSAITGLLLALIAWLVLNSINPELVKGCYNLTPPAKPTNITAPKSADNEPPVIKINPKEVILQVGQKFDPKSGVTITDNKDGSIPVDDPRVEIYGDTFDTHAVSGPYYIIYTARDTEGNIATAQRVVYVGFSPDYEDAGAPVYTGSGYSGGTLGTGGSLNTGGSNKKSSYVGVNVSCDDPNNPTYPPTEKDARAQLSKGGVSVNKSPCPCPSSGAGCTNVGGLPVIQKIIDLKSSCGCDVTVTGGTEPGHKSHGPTLPVVDLRKTDGLSKYIRSHTKIAPAFGGYDTYQLPDGGIYVDEGNHWHVMYK